MMEGSEIPPPEVVNKTKDGLERKNLDSTYDDYVMNDADKKPAPELGFRATALEIDKESLNKEDENPNDEDEDKKMLDEDVKQFENSIRLGDIFIL